MFEKSVKHKKPAILLRWYNPKKFRTFFVRTINTILQQKTILHNKNS